MAHMTTSDGVKIYYEEVGTGDPIVFSHEFGDNYETWEPQLDYFGRRYRCITYAAADSRRQTFRRRWRSTPRPGHPTTSAN